MLLLPAFSCGKEPRKPEDVLSRARMVEVLAELYVTEEKVAQMQLSFDSASKVFEAFRDDLARKTGVPDSVFKKSLQYYSAQPEEIEAIYSVLIDSLQLREQRGDYRSAPR